MEEKRHGGAGRVIVVILILAVLLAAGAFFLFGGRVRVETPSFSTGYRYDRAKDYATLDTFPVEGVTAERAETEADVRRILSAGQIPVLADPRAACRAWLRPDVVVDAILAKKNLGTAITDAPLVIGVGPGFCAGKDCHAVIETMRGHTLGRVIRTGEPIPNTNIPGLIGGFTGERVLRAPDDGIFHQLADIGARVQAGDVVGEVNGKPMACTIAGVIRGMLADGTPVYKGMKSGDVDPRGELSYCYTASDKAIAIGGGVLQAILEYTGVLSNVTGQNAWEV